MLDPNPSTAYRYRAALALARLQPCLLCGGDPNYTGVFIPDAKPNRRVFYALCESCFARPDKAQAAEAVISREAAA